MIWRTKGLWWLSPAGAVLLVVPVTLWLATQATDAQYRARWRVPKALTSATAEMFVAAVLVFALAAMWQLAKTEESPYQPAGPWPHLRSSQVDVLERSLRLFTGSRWAVTRRFSRPLCSMGSPCRHFARH